MQTTNIAWCEYSWNPITGCSHAGPECWNCYAERLRLQQAEQQNPPIGATGLDWTQDNAEENVEMHPGRLDDPHDYRFPDGPGRVFVGSMTDMFHREADPEFVQDVLDVCAEFPEHVWLFLTKRPENAAAWRLDWPTNTRLGTSVGSGPGGEYPSTTHRIEQLRDVDAPSLWASFEPLIEPIDEVALDHIDWAVVGGESGGDERREMDHAWARDLLRQCRAAGVPYFFKQSSGPHAETGTHLSVEVDYDGFVVYEQRRIRETPPTPEAVQRARGDLA